MDNLTPPSQVFQRFSLKTNMNASRVADDHNKAGRGTFNLFPRPQKNFLRLTLTGRYSDPGQFLRFND